MSKSLEELYNSKQALNNIRFNYFENKRNEDANVEHFWFDTIKKELKQAEENEKLLNVFKNALTIEHHEYPTIEHDDNGDIVSYLVKELYTIRQSELDKDMRKALREWVLKNAFPKELKALDIIKKYPNNRNSLANFRYMVGYWERNNVKVTKELLETYDFPFETDEYNLLKEVLL